MNKTVWQVRREFVSLCVRWDVPVPDISAALPSDPCDYTDATHVRINVVAAPDVDAKYHAAHVFGHYLCCLHAESDERDGGAESCDLVADAIARMALGTP